MSDFMAMSDRRACVAEQIEDAGREVCFRHTRLEDEEMRSATRVIRAGVVVESLI
jgi:hypothetical protein